MLFHIKAFVLTCYWQKFACPLVLVQRFTLAWRGTSSDLGGKHGSEMPPRGAGVWVVTPMHSKIIFATIVKKIFFFWFVLLPRLADLGRKIPCNFSEDLFFILRLPVFGRKNSLTFCSSPFGTGLAQGARDDEARRLIMQAWHFLSLWHFFSSNIKTSVSWPKN